MNDSFIHSASRLLFLIPTVITKVILDKDAYQQIIEMYGKDLPKNYVVDIELSSWKHKWLKHDERLRSKTIASLITKWSKNMYPNLPVLLKLATSLPVTSCECERSFSALWRLRTWLGASMTTKTISPLAIINIHSGVQIDYKRAVEIFFRTTPTKVKRFKINIWRGVNMFYRYIY